MSERVTFSPYMLELVPWPGIEASGICAASVNSSFFKNQKTGGIRRVSRYRLAPKDSMEAILVQGL